MPHPPHRSHAWRVPWWSALARARWVFGRHPWLHWAIAVGCALTLGSQTADAARHAHAAAAAWGRTIPVWVTSTDARAGDPVAAVRRRYPAAMVPATAIGDLPPGRRAAHTLDAGEVLTAADLADDATPLPDWVVLGVPADRAPSATDGDRVVLFGAGVRRCEGIVVGGDDQRVEVAVAPSCAPAVTTDLTAGDVTLGRVAVR